MYKCCRPQPSLSSEPVDSSVSGVELAGFSSGCGFDLRPDKTETPDAFGLDTKHTCSVCFEFA